MERLPDEDLLALRKQGYNTAHNMTMPTIGYKEENLYDKDLPGDNIYNDSCMILKISHRDAMLVETLLGKYFPKIEKEVSFQELLIFKILQNTFFQYNNNYCHGNQEDSVKSND